MASFFRSDVFKPSTSSVTYSAFRRTHRLAWKSLLAIGGLLFCLIYGASFALFAPSLILLFLLPIAVLLVLVVWALPSTNKAPISATIVLFYGAIISNYVWPNYLALHLPGLPWITVSRLLGYPLVLLCLVCMSTSIEFRSTTLRALKASPSLSALIIAFAVIQLYFSVVISNNRAVSIDKMTVAIITYAWMIVGVYVFSRRQEIAKLISILWGTALFVGAIGIWQYKIKHVPWAGHIPAFLDVDNPALAQALYGTIRAYTNEYRVNSVFTTSLGLAEYTALVFPFVIHFFLSSTYLAVRLTALLSLCVMVIVVFLTGARIGVLGCLLSVCLYPAFIGIRRWKQNPSSLVGPAISFAYPVVFAGVIFSSFFIGRLKTHIWGGGAQAASTLARTEQLRQAIPLILHNPFGYGIGRGAETLNFQPFGFLTIDSYYILITLEFGIIGFFVYYGMLSLAAFKAAQMALKKSYSDGEQAFALPICISLCSFIIIKSVFSQPDNVGLISVLLSVLIALNYRSSRFTSLVKGEKIAE